MPEVASGAVLVAEDAGSEVGAEVTSGEAEAGADEAGGNSETTDPEDISADGEATMSELTPLDWLAISLLTGGTTSEADSMLDSPVTLVAGETAEEPNTSEGEAKSVVEVSAIGVVCSMLLLITPFDVSGKLLA